jgi:phosphatidylserine/phosphatidylglycerophosphate/cardiolipin synthase-like enzyme
MKISYAITVCNEKVEVKRLVDFILTNKRRQDEIVVLYDQKNGNEEIATMLTKLNKLPNFQMWRGFFDNHFADWKNTLTEYCDGDYIFQIDADEMITEVLIGNLPAILESNPDNEVFLVPRVNTVTGLTQEHISKWRWNVDEEQRVNWPDYQWRIWKNKPEIKWVNKVHEKLEGFKTYAAIPATSELALQHPKTIERQEKQNKYYDTLT